LALRKILTSEQPELRKAARPVVKFDERLHELLDDMYEKLKQAHGAGLAATQVGILRRVVVIDVGEGWIELVNPEIIEVSGEQEVNEGCLSVPGMRGKTKRPAKVKIKALDRNGKQFEMEGEDLLAVAFCHETDHLDGKLYTDIVEGELWEEGSECE